MHDSYGNRLKAAMRRHKVSALDLSFMVGCSEDRITDFKRDRTHPCQSEADTILSATGVAWVEGDREAHITTRARFNARQRAAYARQTGYVEA